MTTKTEPLEEPKACEDSNLDAQKGARLRRFAEADLPTFIAYRNDPDVARYQNWEGISEAEAVAARHRRIAEARNARVGPPARVTLRMAG